MRNILSAIVLSLLSFAVMAAPLIKNTANVNTSSQSSTLATGVGNAAPFGSYNTTTSNTHGSDLSHMVPAITAPSLTTTLTETCMGSTSVGVGWSGAGFSFGTTWRDHACVRRLDARQVHQLGDAEAAKEVMCDSDLVRNAFKNVGRPCFVDGGAYNAVPVANKEVSENPSDFNRDAFMKKYGSDVQE